MLTTRETNVLRLLSSGCTYKKIGTQLGISLHTVGTHIKNAYRKLEVHSAAAAVMRAVELGLLGQESRRLSDPGQLPLGLLPADRDGKAAGHTEPISHG